MLIDILDINKKNREIERVDKLVDISKVNEVSLVIISGCRGGCRIAWGRIIWYNVVDEYRLCLYSEYFADSYCRE